MRHAVAVVTFFRAFVGNGDQFEDGRLAVFQGRQVFFFQLRRKLIEPLRTPFQQHLVTIGYGADLLQVYSLI